VIKTGTGTIRGITDDEIKKALEEKLTDAKQASDVSVDLANFGKRWWNYYPTAVIAPTADEPAPHAQTIYVDKNRIRMFYMIGTNGANTGATYYAYSDDLFTWTKGANNPVLEHGGSGAWDENDCCNINVVSYHSGDVYALYTGRPKGGGLNDIAIGLAVANYWGEKFTKFSGNPIIRAPTSYPGAIIPLGVWKTRDGVWHLLLNSRAPDNGKIYLFEAQTTSDHDSWENWELNSEPLCCFSDILPLGREVYPMNSLLKFGDLFLLSFEASYQGYWQSGLLASRDLKHWFLVDFPLTYGGVVGSCFEKSASNFTIAIWKGKLIAVSGALNADNEWSIGVGILEDNKPYRWVVCTEGTNTRWVGLTTSDTVTSAPIPIGGYSNKTFLFQSNAAGTIAIEVYAGGGWREVVSETVTANSLWDYVLNLEVPIARMKYTPAGSDTIAVAECNLS